MPDPAWSVIFMLIVVLINLVGVRLYGELEYWFALLKILIVIVFIIIGKISIYKKRNLSLMFLLLLSYMCHYWRTWRPHNWFRILE